MAGPDRTVAHAMIRFLGSCLRVGFIVSALITGILFADTHTKHAQTLDELQYAQEQLKHLKTQVIDTNKSYNSAQILPEIDSLLSDLNPPLFTLETTKNIDATSLIFTTETEVFEPVPVHIRARYDAQSLFEHTSADHPQYRFVAGLVALGHLKTEDVQPLSKAYNTQKTYGDHYTEWYLKQAKNTDPLEIFIPNVAVTKAVHTVPTEASVWLTDVSNHGLAQYTDPVTDVTYVFGHSHIWFDDPTPHGAPLADFITDMPETITVDGQIYTLKKSHMVKASNLFQQTNTAANAGHIIVFACASNLDFRHMGVYAPSQ